MEKNYELDLKTIGRRIKSLRKSMGLTQECIAERTELSGQYWSLIENGHYRGSITTYLQIAEALGVTLNTLFYDESQLIHLHPSEEYASLLDGLSGNERPTFLRIVAAVKVAIIESREKN